MCNMYLVSGRPKQKKSKEEIEAEIDLAMEQGIVNCYA